jgi:oligopeptide transport system permease protein
MGTFLVRRLLALIPVWFGITLLTFLLVHSIPGGPFDTGAVRSPEATRWLEDRYHLHEPLWRQFILYLQDVLRGDLGESMVRRGLFVSDVILDRFPTSLTLGTAGLAVSLGVGIPAGVIGAYYRNKWPDYGVMVGATIAYAIPNFVLSLLLILFVGLRLGWLPLGGWGEPRHVILPAIALGLPWAGLVARLTRAAMVEVLREDYIRTAEAKGLTPQRVMIRHGLRNALLPLTTVIAVLAAELITGSLIIEVIFGIPGIGSYMVESVLGSDYTMTLGLTVFYATLIFIANFFADVSYALLDPRIRLV